MKKVLLQILFILPMVSPAISQELEPRAYANVPKGLNLIAVFYNLSKGNVIANPTQPISDLSIVAHSPGIVYVHTFGLFNKLARIQVIAPYTFLSGQLKINGRDTSGARAGLNDARIRFGINLLGSPALSAKEFSQYQQKTVLGLSIVTSVPTGYYLDDKLINIGANRWGFKPEIGISHRFARFYAEAYYGVWLYTQNHQFLENKTLEQKPVHNAQLHVIYYFRNQMWVGVNGNFFNGGKTIVDEEQFSDLKDNWRIGGSFSVPINRQQSAKVQFHVGAYTRTGYDYNLLSLSYQFTFF